MEVKSPVTLAVLDELPLRRAYPVEVSAQALASRLLLVDKTNVDRNPITEAVRFYGLNQLLSKVQQQFTPNTPLPGWASNIVLAYHKELLEQHRYLLWYVFLIITREFRHQHHTLQFYSKHSGVYPESMKNLQKTVVDSSSQSTCDNWLKVVPDLPLYKYCELIAKAFAEGQWGGSYGGPPWAQIANTLARYLRGESSAEVFVDTAYTLAHNTAPIFNKEMLYSTPSASTLAKVLDVQRSGQICEMLIEGVYLDMAYGSSALAAVLNQARPHIPDLGSYVDWYKVEQWAQDGHQYPQHKSQQDKKYGKPQITKLVDGKPVKVTGSYSPYPGVELEVVQRLKAA